MLYNSSEWNLVWDKAHRRQNIWMRGNRIYRQWTTESARLIRWSGEKGAWTHVILNTKFNHIVVF